MVVAVFVMLVVVMESGGNRRGRNNINIEQ